MKSIVIITKKIMNTLEDMDLGDIEHIVPFIKAINLLKEHILVSEMEDFVDKSDPWFPLYESLQDLKEHELELYPDFDEEHLLAEYEQKTTKEQGTQTTLNIFEKELIEWCNDCRSTMGFKINECQDPVYDENGIRRRECLGCGRYAEETISTDPKKTDDSEDVSSDDSEE